MKRFVLLVSLMVFTFSAYCQVSQMIKSKIGNTLSSIPNNHYKGNVSLSDQKEIGNGTYVVIGTFDWEFRTGFTTSIERRKFKAWVKLVFDEIEVTDCCYEYFNMLDGAQCRWVVGYKDNQCNFYL